jgi:phosphotransferase system  glucose/maltose/N-acetylglucosamine-specific IIC component
MEKKQDIKEEMNSLGKLVTFGLSALLAGYLSRKMIQKYPNGEVTNFVKKVFGLFIILFMLVLCLLVIASIIYGVYDALNPAPETVIEKAQRLLREKQQ